MTGYSEDLWPRLEFNGERYEVKMGGSLFLERPFTAIMGKYE